MNGRAANLDSDYRIECANGSLKRFEVAVLVWEHAKLSLPSAIVVGDANTDSSVHILL